MFGINSSPGAWRRIGRLAAGFVCGVALVWSAEAGDTPGPGEVSTAVLAISIGIGLTIAALGLGRKS